MKVSCPECLEETVKTKVSVTDTTVIRHFECAPCGVDIRIED